MLENEKDDIVLFHEKKECSGCGACQNACPKQAVIMQTDEYGFLYPHINPLKCVKCGLCKTVCGYQKQSDGREPQHVFAGASKDDKILMKTASGGIFSVLASQILSQNGIVYGAAMEKKDGKLVVHHIGISSSADLWKLQGSKYVQSETGMIYKEVKEALLQQKKVVFSGTPCQIAGLNGFLGKKYENLLTIDIICHGVPGVKMFQDYIESLEQRIKGSIYEYRFREKEKGQDMSGRFFYSNQRNAKRTRAIDGHRESYYKLFLEGMTYRENCYSCPFASSKRVSDITIGDYWGIQEQHKEELQSSTLSDEKGISCILIHTEKGNQAFQKAAAKCEFFRSDFSKASKYNAQLRTPSKLPEERQMIMEIYKNEGYQKVEQYFKKKQGMKRFYYLGRYIAPKGLKRMIKQLLAVGR
mgnify:CR=1 FL=1